jgi:hypothetical protein
MSTGIGPQVDRLNQLFKKAGTIETLRPLLREIEVVERAGQTAVEIDGIRQQVFEALMRLSIDRPEVAHSIIQDDLVPLCLRAKDDWPGMSMRGRYDELLRKWLDEFPGSARESLRAAAIAVIAEAMKGPQVSPACATIWALGHRTADLVDSLESIGSAHDDEIGDLALRTRVHLGVPEEDRAKILSDLHDRAQRRWNHSLVAALQELADRGSLDVVFGHLEGKMTSSEGEKREPFLDEVTLQILSAIAEHNSHDTPLQDGIWRRLMSAGLAELAESALIMNGNLAACVDSPEVVPTYFSLVVSDSAVRRDIFYYRLEDLVRPRQILGWGHDPDEKALSLLRADAIEGTAMAANWATQELRRKLLAWETLLSLGRTDLSHLIGPAVEAETNGYVMGEIFDMAACMPVDPLPPCVPEFIAGVFTHIAAKDDQQLIAHIGAISVARSARSGEAFFALAKFENVNEQGVLISLIDALAECAAAMMSSGKLDAETVLWHITEKHEAPFRRIAAAAALAKLVRDGHLRHPNSSLLRALIQDESLDIFARRELLDASGYIGGDEVDTDLIALLREMSAGSTAAKDPPAGTYILPSLSQVALRSLARLGLLTDDRELLHSELGLTLDQERGDFELATSRTSSISFVIGVLYAKDPRSFALVVASVIRDGDWLELSRLEPYLGQPTQDSPAAVIDALVERIHRVQTSRTAEPELFSLLARLSPNRAVQEPWGDPSGWMPQARAEFAAAVARASLPTADLQSVLLPLFGDGLYGVRRSAYRAMASADSNALATICESWALAKDGRDATELRQRAAEAGAWLPEPVRTPAIAALAWDPEPTVRQTFDRCNIERRERKWAAIYLEKVLAVNKESDLPATWRYGRALTKVGDDYALQQLEQRRRNRSLSPAVRHWLGRTVKRVRAHWDEVTRRWPEPWFARRGRLEEVTGVVIQGTGPEIPFRCWLWYVVDKTPIEIGTWGGWALDSALFTGSATLRILGRAPAEILVNNMSIPSGITYFSGNGAFPATVEASDEQIPQ